MARMEGIDDRRASLFTRSFYAVVRRKIGRVPEPVRISAHQGRLLAALGGMEMAQEGMCSVDPVVKALAGIKTATPVELPDDLFSAMRRHFDERQLVELTAAIAWENYRARFDHAFGCEAEGFSEGAFCPLPARAGSSGQ